MELGEMWAVGRSGSCMWSLRGRILHLGVGVIAVSPSRRRECLFALMLLLRNVAADFLAMLRRFRLRWMGEIQKLPVHFGSLDRRRRLATCNE